MYTNIGDLHKNRSDLFLADRVGDWILYFETLVSFRRRISELMVPGYDIPMQLLKGEVGWFQGLALNVREDLSAYRQRSYESKFWKVIVIRICSSSHFLCVRRVPES